VEDLDSLIDSRVPKTFDPQCSAHTPARPSRTSLLAGMGMSTTCSPTNAKPSSYILLTIGSLSPDIILALRVDPGSVDALPAHVGEFNARHHILLALLAAQHASRNLFLILGLEMSNSHQKYVARGCIPERVHLWWVSGCAMLSNCCEAECDEECDG